MPITQGTAKMWLLTPFTMKASSDEVHLFKNDFIYFVNIRDYIFNQNSFNKKPFVLSKVCSI